MKTDQKRIVEPVPDPNPDDEWTASQQIWARSLVASSGVPFLSLYENGFNNNNDGELQIDPIQVKKRKNAQLREAGRKSLLIGCMTRPENDLSTKTTTKNSDEIKFRVSELASDLLLAALIPDVGESSNADTKTKNDQSQ